MHQLNPYGQDALTSRLQTIIASGRTPHALLVSGAKGGLLPIALHTARMILCTGEVAAPCEQCQACLMSKSLAHPDLHFSFPTVSKDKKPSTSSSFLNQWRDLVLADSYLSSEEWFDSLDSKNKQVNISKDECLDIVRRISLKSFQSKHKVLVLWLAEYLGKDGNRLLKLIEEPPEGTIFILVTEQKDRLLTTITSRCQDINVPPLKDEAIISYLRERHAIADDDAQTIALLAGGDIQAARKLMQSDTAELPQLMVQWFRLAYIGDPSEMIAFGDEIASRSREDKKQFFKFGLSFVRELLLAQSVGPDAVRLRGQVKASALKLSSVIDASQGLEIAHLFEDMLLGVARNANARLQMTHASLELNRLLKTRRQTIADRSLSTSTIRYGL